MLIRTRSIIIPIKQKTAETFEVILDSPINGIPEKKYYNGGDLEIKESKKNWIAKQAIMSNKISARTMSGENIPIKINQIGLGSELICTLEKKELPESIFLNRVREAESILGNLVKILEN